MTNLGMRRVNSMSILSEGRYGEMIGREWLKNHGYQVFQCDWIAENETGQYFTIECKYQDKFLSPPFDGHGLPLWQIKARLKFQQRHGVRALLLIIDKTTHEIIWQYLDILEEGKHFDTQGDFPRRVYPLTSFISGGKVESLKQPQPHEQHRRF